MITIPYYEKCPYCGSTYTIGHHRGTYMEMECLMCGMLWEVGLDEIEE